MTDSDLIGARFQPGFTPDLTSWRVFIGRNRRLRQEVTVYNPDSEFHKQVLRFRARLSRQDMAGLRRIVERIGFEGFDRHYKHQTMCITDCPSYWITVRFGVRVKEVEAYDLYRLAEFEQQPAMIGFLELWEAITHHTPYGKVPMEAGLRQPWWWFWE
jgi:hypothetical protein